MWHFPLCPIDKLETICPGIPFNYHPGAFGFKRKHEYHTGVDLYCKEGTSVYACEDGIVIGIEPFTGPKDNSPWWRDTDCVLVKVNDGVICYGEIIPSKLEIGQKIKTGDLIGQVEAVLPDGKERPDIPGHSRWMLHLEWYTSDRDKASTPWKLDDQKPKYLLDPTVKLLCCDIALKTLPEWKGKIE
jgi:hypothetical protein